MNPAYTDIRIEPPLSDWSDQLRVASFDSSRLTELRRSARQRLVESAQQFLLRLHGLAEDAGLSPSHAALLTGEPDRQPLVMTGHQPVVFHPGLTFKYATTEQFARTCGAIAIAVVIDTDQGDAGQFSYPEVAEPADPPVRAIDSIGRSNSLYLYGKLRSVPELKEVAGKLLRQLNHLSLPLVARQCGQVFDEFAALASAGASAMEANLIMRWQYGIGSQMPELPLSAIASFPETLTLTADILKQPVRFAAAYNSALDVYRDENNIRNSANPFPNLKVDGNTCELPFWVISHNRRQRYLLEAEVQENVTRLSANGSTIDTFTGNITAESLEPMLVQNIQIVPRGALITAFLRLLFADLFVHGTGGGRYDRFTDEFIRSWWNVEPPPFAIASASQHLFTEQRLELQRVEAIAPLLRELQFNPQRHFGTGILSSQLESRLRDLIRQKQDAVELMKTAHGRGESARDIGRTIQQITNQIRDGVNTEFEPQLRVLTSLTPEQLDAIHCRTYPWFLFPQQAAGA